MRYNRVRHKLLKELSKKYQKNLESSSGLQSGLRKNEISNLLLFRANKMEIIISELLDSEEIIYCDEGGGNEGFMINPLNGYKALSNRKYIRQNNDIIINALKNIVQILIPILSLLIAYTALKISSRIHDDAIKESINDLRNRIELLEQKHSK